MNQFTRRNLFAIPALALIPHLAGAAGERKPRDLLVSVLPASGLRKALLPRERWHPYPTTSERDAWTAVPDDARKRVVARGESLFNTTWPELPATLFLEFARNGNRSRYEAASFRRRHMLRDLVLAECGEGEGRFLDDIATGVWAICEEVFWGVPAHLGMQKAGTGLPDVAEPIVDLFAAETGALLAWTDYLTGAVLDQVSPLIRPRIHSEVERRILQPCRERDDFWWMGFAVDRHLNNWTPWTNSNRLTCTLLLEKDTERRLAAVAKSMRSLDLSLNRYPEDGACDEGPSYWFRAAGSLFDCLELLHGSTNGAIDVYGQPLVKAMARHLYEVHIQDDWVVNFADASARLHPESDLVYRFGKRIGDAKMQGFAAAMDRLRDDELPASSSIGRQLPALLNLSTLRQAPSAQPYVRDAWFPDTQVIVSRSRGGSPRGLFVAAKGGSNAESHNHNDVGNFIVFVSGKPAIIDAGVGTYTAQTFSSRRYEIWTMQSAYHNLPTIGGVVQRNGAEFSASDVRYEAGNKCAEFSLDIAGAYPPEAGVKSWRRSLRLERGRNELEWRDAYELSQHGVPVTLTLMTPCEVDTSRSGELHLGGILRVTYDPAVWTPQVEEIQLDDKRLSGVWGERLWRILLEAGHVPRQGEWTFTITEPA